MSVRFYFYTLDGQEIESDVSNMVGSSAGACIAVKNVSGDWVKKMFDTSKGQLFARTEIGVFKGRDYSERKITIDDFPGHNELLVKNWSPVGSEWFILTSMKPGEELACNVPFKS